MPSTPPFSLLFQFKIYESSIDSPFLFALRCSYFRSSWYLKFGAFAIKRVFNVSLFCCESNNSQMVLIILDTF